MADTPLIHCENVSKRFCRDLKTSLWYGLRDSARDLWGGVTRADLTNQQAELRKSEFWANRDVSFSVCRGQCLGLIGSNGAGKTTLLKMLNGLIKPDGGRITMRGRIGALIALGAGFNPVLTGRENVFVNGSILGLRKIDIAAKLDEIVEFADIESAIDAPVRTYSSGMSVRLGFAIATALEPEVLLVDEVLAVGDVNFKVRCYNRIRELLPSTAVILVSHSMFDVARACTSVCVLEKGEIAYLGDTDTGIHKYNQLNEEDQGEDFLIQTSEGIGDVQVRELSHTTKGLDTSIRLSFSFSSDSKRESHRMRVVLFDYRQTAIAEWDSHYHDINYPIESGSNQVDVTIPGVRLVSGSYRCGVALTDAQNLGYTVNISQGPELYVKSDATAGAAIKL